MVSESGRCHTITNLGRVPQMQSATQVIGAQGPFPKWSIINRPLYCIASRQREVKQAAWAY
jgi:hypothetical protein